MVLLFLAYAVCLQPGSALPLQPGYAAVQRWPSPHATQAAVADEHHIYAISNTTVAQYERSSGKRVRTGTLAGTRHLNSGFLTQGKIYCAHSNYPARPHQSDIRVFDLATGKLSVFHTFTDPPGSLVWCLLREKSWWCCFAHYGKENAKTVLVEMDAQFRERRRWTFPPNIIADWDGASASGGIWDGDTLLVTHHHFPVLYRVRVPKTGTVLEFVEALRSPFPGQGIAVDPTGGLVGIDRARHEIIRATK
ncbi:MAG: hypothetical protein LC104_10170 [Bacteroidales bacterium]|nr:hypothetical protein [Bacteroidales bacterium]